MQVRSVCHLGVSGEKITCNTCSISACSVIYLSYSVNSYLYTRTLWITFGFLLFFLSSLVFKWPDPCTSHHTFKIQVDRILVLLSNLQNKHTHKQQQKPRPPKENLSILDTHFIHETVSLSNNTSTLMPQQESPKERPNSICPLYHIDQFYTVVQNSIQGMGEGGK